MRFLVQPGLRPGAGVANQIKHAENINDLAEERSRTPSFWLKIEKERKEGKNLCTNCKVETERTFYPLLGNQLDT